MIIHAGINPATANGANIPKLAVVPTIATNIAPIKPNPIAFNTRISLPPQSAINEFYGRHTGSPFECNYNSIPATAI